MNSNVLKGMGTAFFILLLIPVFSKESIKNSMWCFTLSNQVKEISKNELDDFSVKYLDSKTKRWKIVDKQMCGWGFQPEFTLESCYQFSAPSNLLAIEIVIYRGQAKTNILIDQIPDSISNYKLIGFSGFEILENNYEYKFSELKYIKVSNHFDKVMRLLVSKNKNPKIETSQNRYYSKKPIKIYIESIDSNQVVELYGCGTPGTLYRVQQWLNGDWIDYNNTWGVKCAHEKFVINRYIVGLTIDRVGVFRVVFDKPTDQKNTFPMLVSNPFSVE